MVDGPPSYFEQYKSELTMTVAGPLARARRTTVDGQMRHAQLGAAFAVAAHFTVHSDPALVNMPTGSGKSGVMTLVPFLLGSARVLVVTPSKLLRDQLATEFTLLKVLRERGAFPANTPRPRVKQAEHRLGDERAWRAFAEFDVVVGTPHVLSPANTGVTAPPSDMFDTVLLDEGHHGAASTWRALIDALPDASIVLFTATPFRRDRHPIPAELVYSYTLQQALDDGVLSPIDFRPVDEPTDSSAAGRDRALAQHAVDLFNTEEHRAADSRIIARTDSIAHAEKLIPIYREIGAQMGMITASTPPGRTRKILKDLRDGALAGLVSVGVLGEGFDFPTMKIGVYHRRHASLPATLQFLGRITRLVPNGPKAVLFAIREETTDETRDLYATDTAWAVLVPALADAAVEDEAERTRFIRDFAPAPDRSLSMSALRPRKDFQVFELAQPNKIDLETSVATLGDGEVIYQGSDSLARMTVIITEHAYRPDWLTVGTLDGHVYELHVVVKDATGRFAFVHGTRDTTIAELLAAMGEPAPKLVEPIWLDRLMTALAVYRYYSVGMRSARAAGGRLAAYRMLAGANVGTAVLPSETRSYGTGHAIAQIYDPMTVTADMLPHTTLRRVGRKTSIGVSYRRGKVFSPDRVHLLDYRKWCDRLVELADQQADVEPTGLPNLSLLSPRIVESFPEHPYLVVMEPASLAQGLMVYTPEGEALPFEELELTVARQSDFELRFEWSPAGTRLWTGSARTDGVVTTNSADLIVDGPALDPVPLSDLLTEIPPTVFYAGGASTMGRALLQPKSEYDDLDPRVVSPWTFEDVDIKKESDPPLVGTMNILTYVTRELATEPGVRFVIIDDRANEIADVIVINEPDDHGRWHITLVHCKFSKERRPGARVEDLYEVLGQAGRSVVWLDPARMAARLLDRLNTGSKVTSGDPDELIATLTDWTSSTVPVRWSIAIAQPGLLASRVNSRSNIKIMLTDVLEWIAQHDATFRVIAHDEAVR